MPYTLGFHGTLDTLPVAVRAVYDGDVEIMEERRTTGGWDPDARAREAFDLRPINIAIMAKSTASIDYLLELGVGLNHPEDQAFLTAARYGNDSLLRQLAAAGADVDSVYRIGGEAYLQAFFGKNWTVLATIAELGHGASRHGGRTFRLAVSDRNLTTAEWFLTQGVDINFNEPDQVYPWGPTALGVAALYLSLSEVTWLIERGADPLIKDREGLRPYSRAVQRGETDIAVYLAEQEPADAHSHLNALELVRKHKVPPTLIEFLSGADRLIDVPNTDLQWIDFYALADVPERKIGRRTVLALSRATGEFDHISIVWDKKARELQWWDLEHKEGGSVGSWESFVADPDTALASLEA